MEEARTVLERLARIEELDRAQAPSERLLGELRELVREAEAWVRAEPDPEGASEAVDRFRSALGRRDHEEVVLRAG